MKLWECVYILQMHSNKGKITDWIWSTDKPTENSIGHYWKHLFKYEVLEYISCVEVDPEITNYNNYKLEIL